MANAQAVEPASYDALAQFLSLSEGGGEPIELIQQWFRLWWDDNPAFRPEMKRGWMLMEQDRIVGFVGNVPSLIQLGGQTVTAFSATTWRVLQEFRNQTMAVVFQWTALGKSAVLFGTTPTDDVVKILQAMRFRLLPPANNRNASLLVLNSRPVIAAMGGDNSLAEFAALISSPVADQVQKFFSRKLRSAEQSSVRRFCSADASFDDLWERTKGLYANTNLRSSAWIDWYCFRPPNCGKILLGYTDENQLRGYTICQPKHHDKLKLLECADFWIEPGYPQVMPALVRAIEASARQEGYDLVMFPHFTEAYGAQLAEIGLFTRELKVKTNYFKPPAGTDVNETNSYFVSAQGDYGLG